MSKTIILLLSSMAPVGAWAAASATTVASHLVIQVVCAVAASFIIFIGILNATDRKSWNRRRALRRSRRTPALVLTPPLPLHPHEPSVWRHLVRDARSGLSA